jgi:hypothetical protein
VEGSVEALSVADWRMEPVMPGDEGDVADGGPLRVVVARLGPLGHATAQS